MKSHLLYTLITVCIFVGIGSLINGLTRKSGKKAQGSESPKFGGPAAVTTGILLISAGLSMLYLFNDLLTEW